jgi:hypothetical protein
MTIDEFFMAEMPARGEEIHHAEQEEVEFVLLAALLNFIGASDGRLTGVRCQRLELGEPDESGRRRPVPIKGSEFEVQRLEHLLLNAPLPCGFIAHGWFYQGLPCRIIPGSEVGVHIKICLRYRMRTYNHLDPVTFFEKALECIDIGARRIPHHQAGSQMNDLGTVLHHLIACIFYVAAGTPVTGCISNQLHISTCVDTERTFFVSHCSEALPSCTAAVAIADDYSDLCF